MSAKRRKRRAAPAETPTVPMQPLVVAKDGMVRFRPNPLVAHLLDHNGRIHMNELALVAATDDERAQFAELIGYSLGGYGELSYVSDARYEAAEAAKPVVP